jgi:hypothetical protein
MSASVGRLAFAVVLAAMATAARADWRGADIRALRFADVHDLLAYRLMVVGLGLAIVLLSVTGVYIRLEERQARLARRSRC